MWERWEYEMGLLWVLGLGVWSPVLRWWPVLLYGLLSTWLLHGLLLLAVFWSPDARRRVVEWLDRFLSTESGFKGHLLFFLGVCSILSAVFKRADKATELATVVKAVQASERLGQPCLLEAYGVQCPAVQLARSWKVGNFVAANVEECGRGWRVYSAQASFPDLLECWARASRDPESALGHGTVANLDLLEEAFSHPKIFQPLFTGYFLISMALSSQMSDGDIRSRFLRILRIIFREDTRTGVRESILLALAYSEFGQLAQSEEAHEILSLLPDLISSDKWGCLGVYATPFIAHHHKEDLRSDAGLRGLLFLAGRRKTCGAIALNRIRKFFIGLWECGQEPQWMELFVPEGLASLLGKLVRESAEKGWGSPELDMCGTWLAWFLDSDWDLRRILLRDAGVTAVVEAARDRFAPVPAASPDEEQERARLIALLPRLRHTRPTIATRLARAPNARISFELI